MQEVVIVTAGRTAIGNFGGTLAKFPAAELGANVICALLEKLQLAPNLVSEVIMGQVLTAGAGQNPARQALIKRRPTGNRSRAYHQPSVWLWAKSDSSRCSSHRPGRRGYHHCRGTRNDEPCPPSSSWLARWFSHGYSQSS